jgi:hypothetical protein
MEEAKWLSIIEKVKRVCENKKWVEGIALTMSRKNYFLSTLPVTCPNHFSPISIFTHLELIIEEVKCHSIIEKCKWV